jgi:hypothetical protein
MSKAAATVTMHPDAQARLEMLTKQTSSGSREDDQEKAKSAERK